MTPSVRAGHKRAAKPKAIAISPRKVKTHQYFEIALIMHVPPFKICSTRAVEQIFADDYLGPTQTCNEENLEHKSPFFNKQTVTKLYQKTSPTNNSPPTSDLSRSYGQACIYALSLLRLLPGLVWVELCHGVYNFSRFLSQILFINHTLVIHNKGHDSGVTIFCRGCNQGKSSNHLPLD